MFDNMFVENKKKVMDTLIGDCTQKKLAKSSNFFIMVNLSGHSIPIPHHSKPFSHLSRQTRILNAGWEWRGIGTDCPVVDKVTFPLIYRFPHF